MQRYRRQREINFGTDYRDFRGREDSLHQEGDLAGEQVEYQAVEPLDRLDEVLWYITSHYEKFNFDFKNDDISEAEQKQREDAVLEALKVILGENIESSVQERYVKAVFSQLKKGVVVEPPSTGRRRVSGKILGGAMTHDLRTRYRSGK